MEPSPFGQALDGRDGWPVRLDCEDQARVDADAIDEHRARAALPDEAALLGAGEPEVVAQDIEERVVRRDVDASAPDR